MSNRLTLRWAIVACVTLFDASVGGDEALPRLPGLVRERSRRSRDEHELEA